MPLTLIKETGDGLVDANSYADTADGAAYHDGHLYPAPWTAATSETQEAALVMATRLIDALFHFKGFRRLSTQALQWPRRWVPDPDNDAGSVFVRMIGRADKILRRLADSPHTCIALASSAKQLHDDASEDRGFKQRPAFIEQDDAWLARHS